MHKEMGSASGRLRPLKACPRHWDGLKVILSNGVYVLKPRTNALQQFPKLILSHTHDLGNGRKGPGGLPFLDGELIGGWQNALANEIKDPLNLGWGWEKIRIHVFFLAIAPHETTTGG